MGSFFAISVPDLQASTKWYSEKLGLRSGAPSDRQGIFKVGVVVKDFDATLAMLRARGVAIFMGPFPKRSDQPAQVIVRDTSGTLIQFFGR